MAGPFYKPYINENRSGIIKQYEQLPVDPAQKDDNGYRHKLAAELKLYEKTQHDQKTRLQDSLKTSLKHQLELKNYQKENAFRMTKREKDINRTGLHNWKESIGESDGHAIPGWGYNSRYKYLGMHNTCKKNLGSSDFPLGGNLHRSVQHQASQVVSKIESSVNLHGDKAFADTAEYRLREEAAPVNKGLGKGGVTRQRTPGGTLNTHGMSNPMYASEPNLHSRLRDATENGYAEENGKLTESAVNMKRDSPEGYMKNHLPQENAYARDFGGQLGALG